MPERIHPTAIVHALAELAPDVRIGPYAVIEGTVKIGRGSVIGPHVCILGRTTIGENNAIFPFAALGAEAQLHKRGDEGPGVRELIIGDGNQIREHVTIHRGSLETPTRIGSKNLLMVGCHVAHDVQVGSSVTIANNVQIAGHAVIEDHVTFGGLAGVAQFVRIGQSAFIAAGAMVETNVPPFVIAQGDRARVRALNRVGLERRKIPAESVKALERAFRQIFRSGDVRAVALSRIQSDDPCVRALVSFMRDPANPPTP